MKHNESDQTQGGEMALLQVQLSDDLKVRLKVFAAQSQQTLSEVTQLALEAYLSQSQTAKK